MSDYSSEDEDAYSTTSVLLGYASKEPTGDEITFLGGTPSWLDHVKPSYDLFQCRACSNAMSQLLQLNGELPEHFPTHDRRLHVLACRRKACARKPGAVRVLRAVRHSNTPTTDQKPQQNSTQKTPMSNLGHDIFGAGMTSSFGANPFAKSTTPAPSSGKATTATEASSSSYSKVAQTNNDDKPPKPYSPWPTEPSETSSFPKLYLDAEYETLDEVKVPYPGSTSQVPGLEDDIVASTKGSASKEDSETFESDLDRTFQRFADRLAQNPDQVLRYEYKGNPLLYSATDEVGKIFNSGTATGRSADKKDIPGCNNCGKSRTFELQITPHAITELEGDEISLDGMEWGTIIAGVCSVDCQANGVDFGSVGYVEEWIGIQWEERKH